MKSAMRVLGLIAVACAFGICGWGQSPPAPASVDKQAPSTEDETKTAVTETPKNPPRDRKKTGPGKEMGKGGEDIGVGAAKGTGDLAKGTGQAVGHLATGNFGSAGASFGKGVGGMGKNVAVGTGKGLGKLGKGVGGEFKKLGGKSKRPDAKT
jgi:hypothetical protein